MRGRMMMAVWATLLAEAQAKLHVTGRTGSPGHSITQGVCYLSVQVGGDNHRPGFIKGSWNKDLMFGPIRTHATITMSDNPSERPTFSLSGGLLDVVYELKRSMKDDNSGTELQLAYSLPAGTQVFADAHVAHGARLRDATIESVSAFHGLGPLNVEPTWLLAAKRLRLKFGRGNARFQCPLSLQTEFAPSGGRGTVDYEIGLRQHLTNERKLRARLLLPSCKPTAFWAEYEDRGLEKEGVWFAKVEVPLDDKTSPEPNGLLGRARLSVRRAWQW